MAETNHTQPTSDDATTEPRENALEVTGLKKVYPDGTLAVDDISFSVQAGDFCVLIGPSGCGKSTTLHSIIGKVEPTSGRIVLDGKDITRTPTHERDIGLVFQDFQLFPHLTVEGNVRYGLERMGRPEDEIEGRVDEVLTLLRLVDTRERSPADLSAGQRQRVALARSLVLEPDLLLLDEPLGDLDYKLQKFMEREFLRLHRELDTTFVYVTHDQTQAMRLGDQIIVMHDGKIEQSGSVDEVYNTPATAFVATFVGDTNVFYGELTDVAADGERATIETDYGAFTVDMTTLRSPAEDLRGRELVFAVRPQFLELASETHNTIECTVEDAIYRPGRGTQVVLEATDGIGGTRELQLMAYEKLELVDETATVGWEPADSILLEEVSVVENADLERDILGE
jgi:ABC-type Fe3+/spermidine/putrescine transport system ATPase subunit